ncbi:MAG: hypothetical protein P8Q36_15985 [Alphaproteobacteria bacterium]|jgi:hypothetical protein|nr:hypothetical protein [Rhodospirillaceae bacterium]MBT7614104.1 hypothetical protein [Rhodospirillaceae bacterium]MBT7647862.1 hypothetical protein [Rhodospirillaceae bacterium]MDG2482348.1 hypothetical protein [Alphaproteobacteria bacterium]
MHLHRWVWIPLILQVLIWALFFIFAFFGFAEVFATAPVDWWADHRVDFWILLGAGLVCLPAYHVVAWLAALADAQVKSKADDLGGLPPMLRGGLEHAGGMFVWGVWLGLLVTLFAGLEVARPENDIPAALLTFAPVELVLWALASGIATITVLALWDQIKGRGSHRAATVMLLNLACYIWFYLSYEDWGSNPADSAWLMVPLATAASVPLAWMMSFESKEIIEANTTDEPRS